VALCYEGPMKRVVLALMLSGTVAGGVCAAELVERIVARVNDRLITQSDYDKRLGVALRAARVPADNDQTRVTVLEDMIREKLLDERAKELSVTATDEEIDAAMARVKRQYNLTTDAEFEAALAQSGMTKDELKRQMRETITLQKVIGREVASKVDLSDDALRVEYERRKEKLYAVPESASVAEIVIHFSTSDEAARSQAAARIEEVKTKLAAGASFGDLAREYSDGNTKDKGGALGTVAKGELVEALDVAVFSTKEEYPAPVLLPDSIHLLHVTDRKQAGFKPFPEVREDLKKRISDDLYEQRFTDYMEKLRREAFVKIYDADLAGLDEKYLKKADKNAGK
jgi:peptidyl-prolyl cis-trans isomerase SurA